MPEIKKILVPTDFSENSKEAIKYAVDFARIFNSELSLIYVIEPIIYPSDFGLSQIPIMPYVDVVQKRADEELKKLAEKMIPPEIKSNTYLKTGKAHVEIIKLADEENFDLLIISTHGHTGFEHIIFGSTAEKVVKKSHIPVLTIVTK